MDIEINSNQNDIIKEGSLISIYIEEGNFILIIPKIWESFDCKKGKFMHEEFIGKKYGTKIYNIHQTNYVYGIKPNNITYLDSLAHRTQIIYQQDIAVILEYLNIKSGDIIIESGTGSGALSTCFAKLLSEKGHLFTYEINEQRASKAMDEFDRLGMKSKVDVINRDVIDKGFKTDKLNGKADVVFLDLPEPWKVMDHVKDILKSGGRFSSFSPCIEQIQKTIDLMNQHQYGEIRMFECLERDFNNIKVNIKSIEQEFEQINAEDKNPKPKCPISYSLLPTKNFHSHTGYLLFGIKL